MIRVFLYIMVQPAFFGAGYLSGMDLEDLERDWGAVVGNFHLEGRRGIQGLTKQ